MNYVQNNLASEVTQYLNAYYDAYPNRVSTYNDTLDSLNDIIDEDLSSFATSTGLTCPSDIVSASCSGSSCASASSASSEAKVIINFLTTLNTKLKKHFVEKLSDQIDTCQDSKGTTQDSNSDDYYYNPGLTLTNLIHIKSPGTQNTTSFLKCSDKTTYDEDKLAAIVRHILQKLNDSVPIPAYISPEFTSTTDVISIAGGFGSISNQDLYTDFSSNFSTIINNRTEANTALQNATDKYRQQLAFFISLKSLALQNIRDIMDARTITFTVPTILNTLPYRSQCADGINSTSSSSDCTFSTPFDNFSIDYNIQAGDSCTLAEVESIQANWRLQPLNSDGVINPWQQIIRSASNKVVTTQNTYLMAEINQQIARNKQLREKLSIIQAAVNLLRAGTSQQQLESFIQKIQGNVNTYSIGGTTDSSSSSVSTTS